MNSRFIGVVLAVAALGAAQATSPLAAGPAQGAGPAKVAVPREWSENDLKVAHHPGTGRIRFVGTPPGRPFHLPGTRPGGAAPPAAETARAFLARYRDQFGIVDPDRETRVQQERRLAGRTVVRLQQLHAGIPVVAGEMNVQIDDGGGVIAAMGEMLPDLALDTTPAIAAAVARAIAVATAAAAHGVDPAVATPTEPELWIVDPALLRPGEGGARLAWRVEVRARVPELIDELVLVDALTGEVVLHFDQVPSARVRETYNAANGTTLPGAFVCGEANPGCTGGDTHAVAAHLAAGDTYDFYMTHHGRDSIDAAGMTLVSSVHYATGYANAYYDGILRQMVYGDAYGFPLADDVVAHELTHGVTNMTSRLMYYYESGAISECFSDVWGEFTDLVNGRGTDTPAVRWLVGEDVSGHGAYRSMQNPPAYNQPDRMSSYLYWLAPDDNGGVHTNSGIGNKAAFLMTDGGTFNGRTVAGLGLDKVAAIFYEVQTNFMTGGSDYADLHDALYQACLNLTGPGGIVAADCAQVAIATDAVEMDALIPGMYGHAAVCPAGMAPADLFFDNIDDTGGANFAESVFAGQSAWSSFWNSYPVSGRYHLLAFEDRINTDAALAMNLDVALPQGIPYLHFDHAFGMHSDPLYAIYYHGGLLEYSTNHGSTWADAGAFSESGGNGYNGWITDSGTNPLHGRPAWGGKSRGYISSRFNLAPIAGQNVRFRWRYGTDNAGADAGWAIDDIRIYTCVAAGPAGCDHPVADGSFEQGTPNPFWAESSTHYGSPLCDMTRCGILQGARTGDWWVGFGRYHFYPETGSVQQSVVLPEGTADLTLYLRIYLSSGNRTDSVRALVDGQQVWSVLEGTAPYTTGYAPVTIDLTPWADGGTHLLRLESTTTGNPYASMFFVDDVAIEACTSETPPIVIAFGSRDIVHITPAVGFESYNLYRGDLAILRASGTYTQVPGSNPLAWKNCALADPAFWDPDIPAPGTGAFYLVSGRLGGVEGSLGTDSAGAERPRTHTCP